MFSLISQVLGSIAGLWLADQLVPGVEILGNWQVLAIIGTVLGLANALLKPILSALTFPLKILTLGLFGLVLNMLFIWLADIAFPELIITGLIPLFWTTAIVWLANFILQQWKK